MGWGCKVATGKIAGGWRGYFGARRGEGVKSRKMLEPKLPVCSKSSKGRPLKSDYGWEADMRMSFVFRLVLGRERIARSGLDEASFCRRIEVTAYTLPRPRAIDVSFLEFAG